MTEQHPTTRTDLVSALRDEVIRQSKAEGDVPWIKVFSAASVQVDGDLNLQGLADAVVSAMAERAETTMLPLEPSDDPRIRRAQLESALAWALDVLGELGVAYAPGDALLQDRITPE